MSQQLYVRDPEAPQNIVGPLTSTKLKSLARTGKIQPSHEVSLDRRRWIKADKVKPPLFNEAMPNRAGKLQQSVQHEDSAPLTDRATSRPGANRFLRAIPLIGGTAVALLLLGGTLWITFSKTGSTRYDDVAHSSINADSQKTGSNPQAQGASDANPTLERRTQDVQPLGPSIDDVIEAANPTMPQSPPPRGGIYQDKTYPLPNQLRGATVRWNGWVVSVKNDHKIRVAVGSSKDLEREQRLSYWYNTQATRYYADITTSAATGCTDGDRVAFTGSLGTDIEANALFKHDRYGGRPRRLIYEIAIRDAKIEILSGAIQETPVLDAHSNSVTALTLSPDDRLLLSGDKDGRIVIWSVADRSIKQQTEIHSEPITCADWSACGERIVTGHKDGLAIVWDLESGKEVCRLEGGGHIKKASFFADGEKVLLQSRHASLKVGEVSNGTLDPLMPGERTRCFGVSPDRSVAVFAAASLEEIRSRKPCSFILWDTVAWREVGRFQAQEYYLPDDISISADAEVMLVDVDPVDPVGDEKFFPVDVWDIPRKRRKHRLLEHRSSIFGMKFYDSGTRAVTCSGRIGYRRRFDASLCLWDTETGKLVDHVKGAFGSLGSCLAVSGNGRYCFSGDLWGDIHLLELLKP